MAEILLFAYGSMLCVVGFVGLATARWELTNVFGVNLGQSTPTDQATFISQYQFLKGLEFGGGVFCLLRRKAIVRGELGTTPFFALAGGGLAGRLAAWLSAGKPSWPFVGFLLLEVAVIAAVVMSRRQADAV